MFDIPRDRILQVKHIDVRLMDEPHPYELANLDAINANWAEEVARLPKLFDGEMILLAHATYRDGVVEGACHPIRFATFMHWRKNRAASHGHHVFANAVPVTSDGQLLAIRMGPDTANAGRVYFAAGSFERQDFVGGVADVDYNIHREVAEETGIDLATVKRDDSFYAYRSAAGLTLIRRYYLAEDAAASARRVQAFIDAEPEPEADRAVIIGGSEDVPDTAPAHMKPLVQWHFSSNVAATRES
ncbi:MAG: hypothetical protein AB3N20_03190 [Rhizobiaceae bacterium]